MKLTWAGVIVGVLSCWGSASAQSNDCRDAFAFHAQSLQDLNMRMEPAVVADVEILVELIGVPNAAKINAMRLQIRRVPGLRNAAALEGKGCRTIVYDPVWAATDTAEFYLALGHEAGHHFCGHTIGEVRSNQWQKELEADQFAGASTKRYEIYHGRSFFDQVFAAATAKYPEQGSPLYPPRSLRLQALARGYTQGSACSNLMPVEEPGFNPGLRSNGPPMPCRPVKTGPTSYTCAQ